MNNNELKKAIKEMEKEIKEIKEITMQDIDNIAKRILKAENDSWDYSFAERENGWVYTVECADEEYVEVFVEWEIVEKEKQNKEYIKKHKYLLEKCYYEGYEEIEEKLNYIVKVKEISII